MPTTSELDLITIDRNGTVIYRYLDTTTQGNKVSTNYRRYPLEAGADVSAAPAEVRSICAIAHTPERAEAARLRKLQAPGLK